MMQKKRFKKECRNCGESFIPSTRFAKLCEKCLNEIRKRDKSIK